MVIWLSRLKHIASFGFIGVTCMAVDGIIMQALISFADVPPLLARLPSVMLAMLLGWLLNRRITFGLKTPPQIKEFLRYAAASALGVSVNYLIFSALMLMTASTALTALIIASFAAAAISYAGYRFFAFKA